MFIILQLYAKKFYHGANLNFLMFGEHELFYSVAVEPRSGAVERHSGGSFEARARKLRPCQAALWPRSFCMDFARTFGRSKSQPWGS